MDTDSLEVKSNPLVSIIVITYNSAKYVLETLESAKAQTYENIELIVSDDASSDNTVEICREWIDGNKDRFVRTELITIETNTGIPANCNRGVYAANGEWVKLIAGDDVLISACIEVNLKETDNDTKILLSEVVEFVEIKDIDIVKMQFGANINPLFINLESAKFQFHFFLKGFYIPGSAIFIQRKKLIELGGFDEKYKLVEDRPLFLKYTYNGLMIKYINSITVGHRRHSGGLTAISKTQVIPQYLVQVFNAIYEYSNLYKNSKFLANAKWHKLILYVILKLGNKGLLCIWLNKVRVTFQPIRFYNFMQRIFK